MLTLFVVNGCSKDDCPNCPGTEIAEKDYHLLYSFGGGFYNSSVYTYSTMTGELLDSAYYGHYPYRDVRFSHDGRYAYYTVQRAYTAATWVTDYASGDTLALLDGVGGNWLSVSHDDRYLLLSDGGVLKLISLPGLEVVYEESRENSWSIGAMHPLREIAVIGNEAIDSLLFLDFSSDKITARSVALEYKEGGAISVGAVAYSADGTELIIYAGDYPCCSGSVIQVRDAETMEVLFESVPAYIGPFVHPDGVRVFFVEPVRDVFGLGNPSSVWELDLNKLAMRKLFDGRDFGAARDTFELDPSDMTFTPDGKYAFLMNGGDGSQDGPILKLDLDTYDFVEVINPPAGLSSTIRICPVQNN